MNREHIQRHYSKIASGYESRWHGYLDSTHQVALRLADPRSDEAILDASGGTGLLSKQIANATGHKARITLIDVSQDMLKQAIARLRDYKNVRILRSDVHNLLFDSKSFTKVMCVNALHFYHNPRKALSEFYRVLRPGGSLVIVDWCRDSIHFKFFDLAKRMLDRAYVRTYSSTELYRLLVEVGFTIQEVTNWSYGLWSLIGIRAVRT